MPKPKNSKIVSLVSAYESGAESESGSEVESNENDSEIEDEQNENSIGSNESENKANSNQPNDENSLSKPIEDTNSNIINIDEDENNHHSNLSAETSAEKPVKMETNDVEIEEKYKTEAVDSNKIEAEPVPNDSIYTLDKGFPVGCELIKLPPAPKAPCSQILQNKIIQVAERMKPPFNYSINDDIQKKKLYKNPSIYEKLIEINKIDEFGSNFPNYIPDLKSHGYLTYLELDEAQRAEWVKKEKDKKERTKIEMVSGTKKK